MIKTRPKAFTLVEVLVSITILTVGILSGFILVTRSLYNVAVIKDRLTASFLAQEGIELVRQKRDTNFLRIFNGESVDWNDGLAAGSYRIESKAGDDDPIQLIPTTPSEAPNFFYNNISRLYNYSEGDSTTFNREIKITTDDNNDEIRVESIIHWRTKKIDFDLTVEDHLYNWLKL